MQTVHIHHCVPELSLDMSIGLPWNGEAAQLNKICFYLPAVENSLDWIPEENQLPEVIFSSVYHQGYPNLPGKFLKPI